MSVFQLIWGWSRRHAYGVLALCFFAIGFFIWISLNPQMFRAEDSIQSLYFADNISIAHEMLIKEFNAKNRGRIQVVPINLPFEKFSTNERKELLTRTLRSKSSKIDIFSVDPIWVPRFAKWASPLDDYFDASELAHVLEHALSSCHYQGRLVGIPLYIDIGILFYRRDLLSKLPDAAKWEEKLHLSLTWDEFISLGMRTRKLTAHFYLFPADAYEGLMCSFIENLLSVDGASAGQDSLIVDTQAAHQALQLMVDLVHRYHLTPVKVCDFKEMDLYPFALAQNAMFFRGWPGNLKQFRNAYQEIVDSIGVAAIPHFRGGRRTAILGGWNLMISKFSERKNEAIEFIKFLSTETSQKTLYQVMGYLPTNTLVYEDSAFYRENPEIQYLRQLLDYGVNRPAIVNYTQISDILTYYLNAAIKNEMNVEDALKMAQRRIRSLGNQ